ncbi:MAG: RluA family pseudouridine synthase [Planctomycetaceae bacterium]|nr:RluA family pseudouridine synthase [Planctomycetaceae bacterium]
MQHEFSIDDESSPTLAAALRALLPGGLSWSKVRRLITDGKVTIGDVVCIDEARRLTAGETVRVYERPAPKPPTEKDVRVVYVDQHVIIAEKPSGMVTLRRANERAWPWSRRQLQPTLDECVPRLIREHAAAKNKSDKLHQHLLRLFPVHRIDRDTSGLLLFARNKDAQTNIIAQFAQHKAVRRYFALVPGKVATQKIVSQLIRDRGDGLRGSTQDTSIGQQAITHITTLRTLGDYSELECRLETGRTNQIRIHLAELGHPICGDVKYRGPLGQDPAADESRARRLCLHAAQLKIEHPETGKVMDFETPWPKPMQVYLNRLQARSMSRR